MEIKFIENELQCMCPVVGQVHTGEQTQEVRLPDAFPDIGKVVGCWGQVLIRGKEWRDTSIGANGGVMAWVLYAPEDGTTPRVVDVWIPFQCRWELPDEAQDGVIHLCPVLTELDARGLSARKLMVRSVVDTYATGMKRHTADISVPSQVPEDVQLLKRNYPAELPMEAGEKQVQFEENLTLPEHLPPIHKMVCFSLKPDIEEQKVLGNRLVFRGTVVVEMTYLSEEGGIHRWASEFPFSQYTQLDRDYSPNASAWVLPILTAAELETVEGQLHLRGGLAAQYTVFDRASVEVIADAFSPLRDVTVRSEQLNLPMLLDRMTMQVPVDGKLSSEADKILSATLYPQYPAVRLEDDPMLCLNGQFQLLTQGADDQLYGQSARFEAQMPFATTPENRHYLWLGNAKQTEISHNADGFELNSGYPVAVQIYSALPIAMVTNLELGELKQPDADRPSVIIRRAGEDGLWGLAKHCGSTVDAIREANQLSGEPDEGQLLLIPVS